MTFEKSAPGYPKQTDIVEYNLPNRIIACVPDVRITSPVPVRGKALYSKQAALPLRAADRSAADKSSKHAALRATNGFGLPLSFSKLLVATMNLVPWNIGCNSVIINVKINNMNY